MNKFLNYPSSIFTAFKSLMIGMKRTFSSMVHPKRILTQQYPENRETLYIPERFKATLYLKKDDEGAYKCTACTLCQTNCPNDTIRIETKTVTLENGKNKRVLATYTYDLGSCTFCGQCVDSCNFDALAFSNDFEQSQYFKDKLIKKLNQ
ncbi:MAG: 4Fe-4S dicluster domain-containing protein [Bacteroidales bacterium]